jgi:predicted glutamine amidotransferase
MCGIAGYIVTQTNDRVRLAISILALEMEDRGHDSWGMFYGTPNESLAVHRVAQSVRKSFDLPEVLPLAMALHTRHATTGNVKAGNAHPFTVKGTQGTVVGMHNGIISNHRELGAKYGRSYRVDSEHIFAHIAEGISLGDLEGYGTVVYSQNGQWFIGRFQGGELSIVTTEFGVFFASTENSLRLALRMAGIPIIKWLNTKDGTLYALDSKGTHSKGAKLDVSSDLFCGKWDDDLAIEGLVGSDDGLNDMDVIHFISEGNDECECCGEPINKGEDLFYTDTQILCKPCFTPSALLDKEGNQ